MPSRDLTRQEKAWVRRPEGKHYLTLKTVQELLAFKGNMKRALTRAFGASWPIELNAVRHGAGNGQYYLPTAQVTEQNAKASSCSSSMEDEAPHAWPL